MKKAPEQSLSAKYAELLKEVEIEAALEAVRGRAMTMQSSGELADVVTTIFSELSKLHITFTRCMIWLIDQDASTATVWMADPAAGKAFSSQMQFFDLAYHKAFITAWKERKGHWAYELKGEEKQVLNELVFSMPGTANTPEEVKAAMTAAEQVTLSFSFSNFGALQVDGSGPLSEVNQGILNRFAKVFNQTYTRFLDLQKAEAQAREAQIETALERVRSRTMAMQRNEELADAASLLFQQVNELGLVTYASGFHIWLEDDVSARAWMCNPDGSMRTSVARNHTGDPFFQQIYDARKSGKEFLVMESGGEELAETYRYMFSDPVVKKEFDKNLNLGFAVPAFQITHCVFFAQGYLMFISHEPCPNMWDVFKRFGKVFQQTYTRFLDLQKAEAQTKEAKIEAALEKVRSRSLAMHQTQELHEVVILVFQKLQDLGIDMDEANIFLFSEGNRDVVQWIADPKRALARSFDTPYFEHPIPAGLWKAKDAGMDFFSNVYPREEKDNFFEYAFEHTDYKYFPDEKKKAIFASDSYAYSVALTKNSAILIPDYSGKLLSKNENEILKRFAKVFEQAYVRFLDLKKAETQTREAQIEVALERTRTQSMLMQHSSELDDTLRVFHQQVLSLGIQSAFSFLWLPDEGKDRHIFWAAWAEKNEADQPDERIPIIFKSKAINYPLDRKEPATAQCLIDWKSNEPVYSYHVPPADVENYFAAWQELINGVEQLKPEHFRGGLYYVEAFMKYGCFGVMMENDLNEAEKKLLVRFAVEFERTYTRFLDLQKAETQAREAQIELSLERVRAKTMAMHNSADVAETAAVMVNELHNLGVETMRCGIGIMHEPADMEVWTVKTDGDGKPDIIVGWLDMKIHPLLSGAYDSWRNNIGHYTYELAGDDLLTYYDAINNYPGYPIHYDTSSLPYLIHHNEFHFAEGNLFAFSLQQLGPEQIKIFKRFAGVFGQTYRRYLDLQKAEKQTKEAQIEATLERVRSKTMAMHKSADVGDAMATMFDQLIKLGIDPSTRCGVGIIDDTKHMEVWTAYASADDKVDLVKGRIDMTIHQMLNGVFNSWKNKELHSSYVLIGEDQKDYYRAINHSDYHAHFKIGDLPPTQYQNAFYFPEGFIYVFSHNQLSAEIIAIFKRFAGVFGLTYKRFLDLQNAEEQAREAKIEAGLERVRSSTMAMQASDELAETAVVVFKQLIGLGIEPNRLFIGIIKDDSGDIELWATDEDGSRMSKRFTGNINCNASVKKMYEGWQEQKTSITIDMQGKELKDYFYYLKTELHVPFKPGTTQKRQVQLITYFPQGFIGMASPDVQPPETYSLLERFAGVFNLTYTRFNDLQKAEKQAREAIKQASLDRVRGEIASMRTSNDLDRIIPLIWNELIALGVPFIRCGVFIVDEAAEIIHYYLATPDGKALAAFQLPFTAEGVGHNVLHSWQKNEFFTIHWNAEEFAAYTKSLVDQGAMAARESYITAQPLTSLDLHFFPFTQGTLYVGNIALLNEDQRKLVQSLALAFSTAYARYEDFNRLEVAKQQVENTLTELKSAQTKLVQSEKMASLGELTAGIAHEIQNPLNFVNNFSEVNREMIDELEEELLAGNIEEAIAIAADIKQNEQKITHHGKRADAIVKGMLEHSRAGTGERQPTDINVLADEFLKLSYHGLRAKDKSFNAEMITNFDPNLPKIQLVQQDIGRLLINLFNNAFYAVNQKKKTSGPDYKPTIEVTSFFLPLQGIGGLKVRDNGTGISDQIKDKIMQPFFTTKPTGEGTGLGLSLSYDIVVKGHGGSIVVNSTQNNGAEFIVQLPLT